MVVETAFVAFGLIHGYYEVLTPSAFFVNAIGVGYIFLAYRLRNGVERPTRRRVAGTILTTICIYIVLFALRLWMNVR